VPKRILRRVEPHVACGRQLFETHERAIEGTASLEVGHGQSDLYRGQQLRRRIRRDHELDRLAVGIRHERGTTTVSRQLRELRRGEPVLLETLRQRCFVGEMERQESQPGGRGHPSAFVTAVADASRQLQLLRPCTKARDSTAVPDVERRELLETERSAVELEHLFCRHVEPPKNIHRRLPQDAGRRALRGARLAVTAICSGRAVVLRTAQSGKQRG
jgi:hypothetical protein